MRSNNTVSSIIRVVVMSSIVIAIVSILTAVPVWLLWNALMPDVFRLPELRFMQAFGLALLARCLFGTGNGGSSSK